MEQHDVIGLATHLAHMRVLQNIGDAHVWETPTESGDEVYSERAQEIFNNYYDFYSNAIEDYLNGEYLNGEEID